MLQDPRLALALCCFALLLLGVDVHLIGGFRDASDFDGVRKVGLLEPPPVDGGGVEELEGAEPEGALADQGPALGARGPLTHRALAVATGPVQNVHRTRRVGDIVHNATRALCDKREDRRKEKRERKR